MAFDKLMQFIQEERPKIDTVMEQIMRQANTVLSEELPDEYNEVLNHIHSFAMSKGKRLRPILTLLGYKGVKGYVSEAVYPVASALELLHASFLVHDDIMDRDEIRRGEPSLWKRLENGVKILDGTEDALALAIIPGNILNAYSNYAVLSAPLPAETKLRATQHLLDIINVTNRGQILDVLVGKMPVEKVREEDVMKVHELKTARYTFESPLHMGAIAAEAGEQVFQWYSDYAIPVGIAFQLQDDILGLYGDEKKVGKPVGSDVREGKRTLLVVKAYQWGNDYQRKRIKELLGKKDLTLEELEEFREIVRETGALDYTVKKAEELVEQGKGAIERADIDGETKEILKELAEYIIKREK